jgi:hypothetical protein
MTPSILLNLVWIGGVLAIAFYFLRKEHLKEKQQEQEEKAQLDATDKKRAKLQKSYAQQYIELPEGDFPNLERDQFQLADLALFATQNPPDVSLPSLKLKRLVGPGDLVLVGLLVADEDEYVEAVVKVATRLDQHIWQGEIFDVADTAFTKFAGRQILLHANHIGEIIQGDAGKLSH